MAVRRRVTLKLSPEHVIGKTGDVLEQNMHVAVVWVRDRIKEKLNRGQRRKILKSGHIIGLDPSAPGEPPKKITAQLQNSIAGDVRRTRNSIVGRVGSPLKKAKHLEFGTSKMAARPFLRPTIAENKVKIARIMVLGRAGI